MTKSELKEMIRECLREELAKTSLTEGAMSGDYAQSGAIDRYARPGGSTQPDHKTYLGRLKGKNPDLVDIMTVKGKDIKPGMITQAGQVKEAEVRKNNRGETKVYIMHTNDYDGFWDVDEDMEVLADPDNKSKPFTGDYRDLLKKGLKESASEDELTESTLTAEEKVDAWHAGTRRENYKAAGIPKLNTFLEIAKRKGYTDIVDIIEAELAKRGVTPTVVAPTATTNPVSTSTTTASDVEPEVEVPVTDIEEPPHFSDELVKELEAPVLTDKEKDVLIGKAIDYLGKVAFYARSYWRTAMGFTGSYSTTWYNGNYNEIKADRAKDRVRDLTYASDRLIVLRSHFDGGSHNIDRYYSIEVPSSTKYIVDTDKIRDMMYSSYYDSEIDWRISTLTKTPANRKKFKQYLIDTAGMPADQAEELTTYAFDKRVW